LNLENSIGHPTSQKSFYTVKNVNEWFLSSTRNHGMSLIKLFLSRNTSALRKCNLAGQDYHCLIGVVFRDQEWKIPGNPEIPEVLPSRKSLISDIQGLRLGGITHCAAVALVFCYAE
jgi:hypothetical protein